MLYFVVSDIHSDYKGLRRSLNLAGFQKRNKNHTLVVCGDIFDRFDQPIKVYKFLTSIPKKRRILIKGNHEDLFFNILEKDDPDVYDYYNGTLDTIERIARWLEPAADLYKDWPTVCELIKKSEIYTWLKSSEWVNYAEIGKYIFAHSFIPTIYSAQMLVDREEYDPDWRNASNSAWYHARWGCPYQQYKDGLFDPEKQNGKVLVVGHWHTGDFYLHLAPNNCFPKFPGAIWYGRHLIGLDGGIYRQGGTLIHQQNVLIIDSDAPDECSEAHLGKLIYQDLDLQETEEN